MKKILPFLILNVFLYLMFAFWEGNFNLMSATKDFRIGITFIALVVNLINLVAFLYRD